MTPRSAGEFKPEPMTEIARLVKGALVRHKTKGYIGSFDGFTYIRGLFELSSDTVGCRVLVNFRVQEQRQIASPKNLDVLASLPLEERHKANLAFFGATWKGISGPHGTLPAQPRRTAHCWFCKHPVDNAVDFECDTCRWILCHCGACGCGYKRIT